MLSKKIRTYSGEKIGAILITEEKKITLDTKLIFELKQEKDLFNRIVDNFAVEIADYITDLEEGHEYAKFYINRNEELIKYEVTLTKENINDEEVSEIYGIALTIHTQETPLISDVFELYEFWSIFRGKFAAFPHDIKKIEQKFESDFRGENNNWGELAYRALTRK